MDLIKYNFTKDFLKEMEAGAQKWSQKGTQKWTQNRTPFGEPRCSATQGIQRVLELFGLSEGSSFGLISGLILGTIPGPQKFGTFQVLIKFNEGCKCKMAKMNSGKSDFRDFGKLKFKICC